MTDFFSLLTELFSSEPPPPQELLGQRIQVAAAEMDKSEQVLQYMLRPSFEDCLNLWFGK